ncbi:hypothetical protein ALT1644_20126 [Alteromonas macleodii]
MLTLKLILNKQEACDFLTTNNFSFIDKKIARKMRGDAIAIGFNPAYKFASFLTYTTRS